ncbi:hypothetical protein IWW45_004243 [Coemansia sp. RSA 485]|nr:hypothetical protein IWW45_004243 [Coemansia sp. RSA 485]KAJ2601562.1 hypothetical protein GGF39_001203 [Coemansia sp. RSA 1721]
MSFMKWMSGNSSSNGNNGSGNNGTSFLTSGANGSSSSEWPDNDDRYYGLINVGNTCYCSSVLESLYFCRAFRDCVNNYPYPRALPWKPRPAAGPGIQRQREEAEAADNEGKNMNLRTPERSAAVPATASSSGNTDSSGVNGHGAAASDNHSNLSRGRTLLSIKERAVGLRWKRDKSGNSASGSDITSSVATSVVANESNDSKGGPGMAGGAADNDDGQSRMGEAATATKSVSTGDGHTDTREQQQQQQERSAIDVLTEDISSSAKYGIESSMFSELKDLFWLISTRIQRTGSLSPQGLVMKLKETNELFRSNAHQDAHEFLNYLLNEIAENVEKIYQDKGLRSSSGAPLHGENPFHGKTWVHTLFEGLLTNETRCLSCERVTSRDERILDVSVDIHENTSVTNCLNQFAAGELLCHNNKFYCDSCGGLQEAERRMRLKRLPNILALHLKRFKYHEGLGRYVKLSYRVNFPTELRVPNTTEETGDCLYSLSAVVVHLGGGPFHGHYISIVRSEDRWVLFDDDCVEIIQENELNNYFGDLPGFGSGYVLFYERTDFDPMQYDLPRPFGVSAEQSAPTSLSTSRSVPRDIDGSIIEEKGLQPSMTMPNLEVAAAQPAELSKEKEAEGETSTQFVAPMRPPPLISTSRSIHGGADAAQMSPSLLTSATLPTGAMTAPSPAQQRNSQGKYDNGTLPSTTSSFAPMAGVQPVGGAKSSVQQPPLTQEVHRSSLSKSRSWFSRRSKK